MVLRFLLNLALFLLIVFLILGLAPFEPNLDVRHYELKPTPEFFGPLTRNTGLNSAEMLFLDQFEGPESVAVGKDNALYTGIEDGRIIKISNGKIQTVVRVGGKNCDSDPNKKTCGRPLGLRFDAQGFLVVADSVKGIYKVNVATGEIIPLVKSSAIVNGKSIAFADDITVSKSGDIYFTDVGTPYSVKFIVLHFIEHAPHGRVLHYNAKTKEVVELIDNLYMPNGIQLTPEEDALIISHTFESNLLRYYIKGPKKGQLDTFSDNLPGYPDNIRISPRNTYWVALPGVKIPNTLTFNERFAQCPIARKAIYRGIFYMYQLCKTLEEMTSFEIFNFLWKDIERCIEATVSHKYGLIVEVNQDGQIIRSFHSPDGSRGKYSEITEHQNVLYLGSPFNHYLGKLKIQN